LRLDIAAASSGAELGRQLGVSRAAVSSYLKSLTKAVEG
jgi:biotin operon repressor